MMRYYWWIIFLLTASCHEQNKNKVSTAELVKSREIRQISEAMLLNAGATLGDEIMMKISTSIQTKNLDDSISCDINRWTLLDSLEKAYESEIKVIDQGIANMTTLEYQLLEAYQYNLDNDLKMSSSIQKLDKKTVLYTWPVGKESKLYQQCLDSASRQKVKMWCLKIAVKHIIQQL